MKGITSYDDVEKDVEDAADVVIIGSGAAGATAARVLTEAGLDVVLVEEGPWVPLEQRTSDMYTSMQWMWRDMGFQVGQGRAFIPFLQGRCVGGTTVINGAIIHRMPEAIHDVWCKERGIGDVLRYDDLDRIWDRLDEELSVGPSPEETLGGNNRLMRKGVEGMGIRGNLIRRNVDGCRGSAHCNQGCPTGRKQGMDMTYVPRSLEAGARLYATCRIDRLLVKDGRAAGVRGRFRHPLRHDTSHQLTVKARHAVVVCASAVQTPHLLVANGIGRTSGLVGRRLQGHPGCGVVGLFDEPVKVWSGATQGFETTHYWDERMKFEAVGMPLEFGAARMPGIGPDLMQQLGDYGHTAIWGVQVRAKAHGRVYRNFFGRRAIDYDMLDEDVERMKLGVKRLVRMAFEAGAREVLPGVFGLPERITSADGVEAIDQLPNDPRRFHCIVSHIFGTAVLGQTNQDSIVGPELEAHDLPGLFVTDSSVFPTNLGVNPQHSICAMSWWASERLAEGALQRKSRGTAAA